MILSGRHWIRDAYRLFVSCSLYLVINTVLILIISAVFLGTTPLAAGIGFLTLASLTAFVYISDRLHITDEDRINNPDRTALVETYERELRAIAIISFVLFEYSIILSAVQSARSTVVVALLGQVPLIVLAVYDYIKTASVPLDSVAVAFSWSYQICYVFVFLTPVAVDLTHGTVLFGSWFLIVFAGLEMRNANDIEGDREAEKVTFACYFGTKATRRIGLGIKACGAVVLAVFSGSLLVTAVLAVHLLLLQLYSTLETDFQSVSQGSTGEST